MKASGNTVLITDAGSGIGTAIARSLLEAGNQVILCGSDQKQLDEALSVLPALHTYACDLALASKRMRLHHLICRHFPRLNLLINDASRAEFDDLARVNAAEDVATELTADLQTPVLLTMLFLPHLLKQPEAAIINITTPSAISPGDQYPAHRAAREGLRSFAGSLRHFLKGSRVSILEVPSPAAASIIAARTAKTIDPAEVAEMVMHEMQRDDSRGRSGWMSAALHRLLPNITQPISNTTR